MVKLHHVGVQARLMSSALRIESPVTSRIANVPGDLLFNQIRMKSV